MPEAPPIYLDHAATTPVAPEVLEAMRPYFRDDFANAATLYDSGRRAAEAVARAREQVAQLLGAASPDEVFFTSGGTESNNWAIQATAQRKPGRPIVTSTIEHPAVLRTVQFVEKAYGCPAVYLPVDAYGLLNPDDLRGAIRDDTALVTLMHANNEIGTLEPLAELAAVARERGVPFHTDAVQAVGKVPIRVAEFGVDMLSLSAHKFGGPKGVGALYVRRGVRLGPLLHGGEQEGGRRGGTTNVPGVVGLGAAAALAQASMEENAARESAFVERLWQGLSARIPQIRRNGHPTRRLPRILNVSLAGAEGEAVLLTLDEQGIQIAAGSACASGGHDPSHVLLALGVPSELARATVRFSLGSETTAAEIDRTIEATVATAQHLRAANPAWPA